MTRPKLLDLFCGAGGAAVGYHRAGFDVVGVDIKPQPNYPFQFIQGDALKVLAALPEAASNRQWLGSFDAIHASPPCQRYSNLTSRWNRQHLHPDLIAPVRNALILSERPYVIENVQGAPLVDASRYCGSSFCLNVRRHRLFESNCSLEAPACQHDWQTPRFRHLDKRRGPDRLAGVVGVHGHINYAGEFALRCEAMGIDWMTNAELVESIPPAYTEHIGRQLIACLQEDCAAA